MLRGEDLYRRLLTLYPARFREEFGKPLEQQFLDEYREAEGTLARIAFWMRLCVDLAVSIPRELLRELRQDLQYSLRVYSRRPAVTLLALAALTLLPTALFVGRTLQNLPTWRDSESLWTYAMTRSRDYRPSTNLAQIRIEQNRLQEAEQLLLSESRAQGKEVRFELRVDPSLPPVSGHPDTVYRALLNVMKNAVEAIDQAGTVRIEARMNVNYRFARGRGRKRSFIEVEIADSGMGMTGEELRKALLPFYTTKARGTGLGLVMARQAVTRLGGKMEIRSSPGAGTTVKISLPIDPGRKAAP